MFCLFCCVVVNGMGVEAIPSKRSEVIAGKYIVQYIFAAASTAAVQPLLDAIGSGWTFTICMFSLLTSHLCVLSGN